MHGQLQNSPRRDPFQDKHKALSLLAAQLLERRSSRFPVYTECNGVHGNKNKSEQVSESDTMFIQFSSSVFQFSLPLRNTDR